MRVAERADIILHHILKKIFLRGDAGVFFVPPENVCTCKTDLHTKAPEPVLESLLPCCSTIESFRFAFFAAGGSVDAAAGVTTPEEEPDEERDENEG